MAKPRVIVLGIDAGNMADLQGRTLARFRNEGICGPLKSTFPPLTAIAWTTMVSGVNAGQHGIFSFLKRGNRKHPYSSRDKHALELWDYVPSIAVGVPLTYPVRKKDVMISGWVGSDKLAALSCYPPILVPDLLSRGWKMSRPRRTPAECTQDMRAQLKCMFYLLERPNWELYFMVLSQFDFLLHRDYAEQGRLYTVLNNVVARLLREYPDDYIMIVSDHGGCAVQRDFSLKTWLRNKYPQVKGIRMSGWGEMWFPNPKVQHSVTQALRAYRHQGKRILDVWLPKNIYHGPYVADAADLIVWPKRELGYSFTFGVHQREVVSASKSGCHAQDGVFGLLGPGVIERCIKANILDVAPTILTLLGRDIPSCMEGKSIVHG